MSKSPAEKLADDIRYLNDKHAETLREVTRDCDDVSIGLAYDEFCGHAFVAWPSIARQLAALAEQIAAVTTKIEVGQIYIAADGGRYGHLVTDTTTHADCGEVVTRPFDASGWVSDGYLIDGFKLAAVRYSLQTAAPSWMPPAP